MTLECPKSFFPPVDEKVNTFIGFVTKKQNEIRRFITCSSTKVIYLLTCPCGFQYFGKKNRQLRTMINEHHTVVTFTLQSRTKAATVGK